MEIPHTELIRVLRQFNPWWSGRSIPGLSEWKRTAFDEISAWAESPPAHRALLLSGPRQAGKTTLFLQVIEHLLRSGTPGGNIIYVTFDHPVLKLVGPDGIIRAWNEIEPSRSGTEFLFLDEIQTVEAWQVWLKLQVDFEKHRRIALTGSALPLMEVGQESGVGRWHTLKISTLSFSEYLQLRRETLPDIPEVPSLTDLFGRDEGWFASVGEECRPLTGLFHSYLLRGGYPETAMMESVPLAQKLLREDIVDKVLKRDMTALFGVRRVLELEQTFLYLCLHDGGMLDLATLCNNLDVTKPTARNFIAMLEAAHLIYRLKPFGYGKEILRGREKIYLTDPAVAPAVMLRGRGILEDPTALGHAVETAFFKHVFARYYSQSIAFSYWRDTATGQEVDIIADTGERIVPFEIKYRGGGAEAKNLKGLQAFCKKRSIADAYVITRDAADFGITPLDRAGRSRAMRIPAPLACWWLGK